MNDDICPEAFDCPPPRRWPTDAVDYPMTAIQQAYHDRIVAAAGLHPWELSETARFVLRWLAAGDNTVCDGVVELVERVREAGFDEASDLALYPLYRADETVATTVTVGELAERGLIEEGQSLDCDTCRPEAQP